MTAVFSRLQWYRKRVATSIEFHGVLYTAFWFVMFALRQAQTNWFFAFRARHFDRRFGIDTAQAIAMDGLGVTSQQAEKSNHYETCTPECLSEILVKLDIPFEDRIFIDLGSGKGTALIVASHFPFERIVGVEWSSQVAEISRQNIHNYHSRWQKCRNIEVIEGDALAYEFPNRPLVVYLYNPFKEELVRQMLQNLGDSLAKHPRPVSVVYYNPICKNVFVESPFLQLIEIHEEYPAVAIYKSVAAPAHAAPAAGPSSSRAGEKHSHSSVQAA